LSSHAESAEKECRKPCSAACAYVCASVGALLIVAGLVWVMLHYTRPAPLGGDRAAERSKALAELRANNEEVLNNPNYVWQDQNKGIVRLPISRAMELALKLWQNPASARTNLTARVEKATAVAPPQVFE
jgi:hypothetical protein